MNRNRIILAIVFGFGLCLSILVWVKGPQLRNSVMSYLPFGDSSNYDSFIRVISKRYGVDFHLVKAVIKAESKFDHLAVSPRGAMGLMQVTQVTADQVGISDPFDPEENIEGGVRYLKWLLKIFDNDVKLALAAYNAGPTTVKRYRGIPPYAETRAYLKKVLKFYSDYKQKS